MGVQIITVRGEWTVRIPAKVSMYFLAIDTATNSGGVAISRNSEVVASLMLKTPLKYSERLVPSVRMVLQILGLDIDQIDCFVVAAGPGSFTGLRIGIATVKAFAQALEKPCVGLSTLEALALQHGRSGEWISPMIDARRQQVYAALFRMGEIWPQPIDSGQVLSPSRWLEGLPDEDCVFVGDGALMYRTAIAARRNGDRIAGVDNFLLPALCRLGFKRYTHGEILPPEQIQAIYIRPSDAHRTN